MFRLYSTLLPICALFLFPLRSPEAQQNGHPTQIHLPLKTILFGRGLYPGVDNVYNIMRASKFKTIVVSSYYFVANGNVVCGDHPKSVIIRNGQYVGASVFLRRIAALKQNARIEFLLESRNGTGLPNTFGNIRRWAKTAAGLDTLNKICQAFKAIGADGLCDDDEDTHDLSSTLALGKLLGQLGMHLTLCPWTDNGFWRQVIDGSTSEQGLIDGVYLQCYSGGIYNKPGPWFRSLGHKVPVYPIFSCRGGFDTCDPSNGSLLPVGIKAKMENFAKAYPGLSGGGIWQMADVISYVKMKCAANPITVAEYLRRLGNAVTPAVDVSSP